MNEICCSWMKLTTTTQLFQDGWNVMKLTKSFIDMKFSIQMI